jgi:hypothetical protein
MKSSEHLRDILNAASGFPVSLQGVEKDVIKMHETLPIDQQKSTDQESIDAPGDLLNVPPLPSDVSLWIMESNCDMQFKEDYEVKFLRYLSTVSPGG